jgi:transposase
VFPGGRSGKPLSNVSMSMLLWRMGRGDLTVHGYRRAPGLTPRLPDGQGAELARWVEKGADLERDGVVRWRCRDLQARIAHGFGVRFHERTVGKLPARLRFRRLSVRPRHPESDPAAQEAFRGASPSW